MTPDLEIAQRRSADPLTVTRFRSPRTAHSPTATADARVLDFNRATEIAQARLHSVDAYARPRYERVSRVVNATLAALALGLLSPLFFAIALAIKMTSRGPIFYLQPRVGINRRGRGSDRGIDRRNRDLGGRIFTIYKFRSMRVDAEKHSGAVWATKADARVTPIGRFLRKTRLDELPQLINVLQGDMNIVGPRPERPGIFARLREDIAEYPLRQVARPGITGWAQVNQPYDSCLDDVRRKVEYDLEYLQRRSVTEDLRIMAKTIPVMLFYRGGW